MDFKHLEIHLIGSDKIIETDSCQNVYEQIEKNGNHFVMVPGTDKINYSINKNAISYVIRS